MIVFSSVLITYISFKNEPAKEGQANYKAAVIDVENKNVRSSTYRRNAYSDKISLDNLERRTALKVKRKLISIDFNGKHIVALGDSLTKGIGDNFTQGGFVSVIERTINKDHKIASFKNYGKQGEQSAQLLRRLNSKEVKTDIKKAHIIIIAVGANDIIQVLQDHFTDLSINLFTKEQASFEKRLTNILQKLNQINSKTKIYLVGLYNPFENYFGDIYELDQIINNWNKASSDVADGFQNVTFIPVKDLFSNNKNLFAEDHFHPNERGYVKIAERILDYLIEEGEKHEEQ